MSIKSSPLWPAGTDLVILDEVDSTMAEAARRAPPQGPVWILTHNQTEGRGRRGRNWQDPQGNFAATYLYRPNLTPQQAGLVSFQAALALFDALSLYVPKDRLSLKWPNDVLLDGRKVAGILLESSGVGGDLHWLSVGIGINLAMAPKPEQIEADALPPISLADVGATTPAGQPGPITAMEVLEHLAAAFERHGQTLQTTGFDPLRRLWLNHAARLGEVIKARTANDELIGTFIDVDGEGQLVLDTAKGRVAIPAADVFFD